MFKLLGSAGNSFGEFSTFAEASAAAADKFGSATVVGDLERGRALVWDSEGRAANDSGYAACAKIEDDGYEMYSGA